MGIWLIVGMKFDNGDLVDSGGIWLMVGIWLWG